MPTDCELMSVSPRQMLGRITGLKRSLAQIFMLALALEAFMLLSPFLMQWVVDDVLVSADRDLLATLTRDRDVAIVSATNGKTTSVVVDTPVDSGSVMERKDKDPGDSAEDGGHH